MTGNNHILLDTSIVVELFTGNKIIADRISKQTEFYVPAIVLGELYTGIFSSGQESKNLKKLKDFLTIATILEIDEQTAEYYGKIMSELRKRGKPIPTNDVWIAAMALQYEFTLIARDKHFKEIKNLILKEW
jgi:tRNA(fMet)-specific endonuclease VapC